jgi:adenylate cyclase
MRSYVKEILISVIYWSLVNMFIVTVRFVGIDFFYEPRSDMPLIEIYSVSLPGGLIFGLGWGLIEIIYNRVTSKKRRSFGIVVVSKTLIYTTLFIGIAFLASWPGMGSSEMAESYMTSAFTIVNFGLFMMAAFLFIFFKQMNKMFGPGILLQYLTGKYFIPKEEDRIFMFLDLKSSTSIAEKLSHVLYSKLIQDCFSELTDPVLDCKGQIYQYVGDEVVITWKKEDGLNNANCLNFYYDFINRLESKKEFFLRSYKVFPEFKAGLSLGLVTVAEVGELKTEIAYHGDVLNTAARIEGYCSEFNKPLLASEALVQELEDNDQYTTQLIGEKQLRGKKENTRIYSCEKPTANKS